jgi:hypothetical protein
MITNMRRSPASARALSLALLGAFAASACANSGAGGSGAGGSTGSGGTTGAGGSPSVTGNGGSNSTGVGGSTGPTGVGGSPGSTGVGGSGASGSTGSGGSTGGGGSTGNGGTIGGGGTTGAGGAATGGSSGGATGGNAGGHAGAAGSSGVGGATNCAGHAISFNSNVAAGNDPAKARVMVDLMTDLPINASARTIEFWAYVLTTSWAGDDNTMFEYGNTSPSNGGFGLDFGTTPAGTLDPYTNGSFDNDNQPSGLSATMNQWAHFAMTWDGTTVRLFVNGNTTPISKTSSGNTLATAQTQLTIGGNPRGAYFNGYIDEFRVWNVARSQSEIASTMNHTLVGNETGLVGYWKFDETSGTTAADSVTSPGHTAHPGTLMADTAAHDPSWIVSTAPITCP